MKKTTLISLLLVAVTTCFGQVNFTAQLKNAKTSEPIESAFVRLSNSSGATSTYSTPNGTINMVNIPKGVYTISISHASYKTNVGTIDLNQNSKDKIYFLEADMAFLDAASISTVRAKHSTPTTFTNIERKEIESLDQSKDFPFLLNMTPSTVVSSDAGNGVGYTGVRIRGIDPTRVNITVNGIPINDAESQGMYWVNMPDLASSTESVQIQRGVGTSTNGSSAFGASVNIRTNELSEDKFTRADLGYGSFNTQRVSLTHSTGRLKGNWAFQLRGSLIQSDGFIDRASSNLKSANITAAKYWEKSVFKTNILLGSERTYQAWYGIPQPTFNGDIAGENRYINQLYIGGSELQNLQNSNSKTYNSYTYENEVDNYNQNHYQFFFDHKFSPFLKLNTAAYVTTGKGYFEQFKNGETLADYGIDSIQPTGDTAFEGDLVRRRWLENVLVGGIANATYSKNKFETVIGGGYSNYQGKHFGEAIATEFTGYEDIKARYYDNDATKTDGNFYIRQSYNFNNLIPYIDLQYRFINYQFDGLDDSLNFNDQEVSYGFFNPKMGLTYLLKNHTFYGVFAIANREPVRDDFRDNKPSEWPEHEAMENVELGYRYTNGRKRLNLNLYTMNYTNQLVLTGAVNDVGEAIRTNVKESFRQGIELDFQYPITENLQAGGNLTLSQNKIESFTEYVGEWDGTYGTISTQYNNTDISFSPNTIAAAMLSYKANDHFTLNAQGKYVGKQYLDNTQNNARSLDAFTNMDVSLNYTSKEIKGTKLLNIGLYLNNVFNQYYAPNGYTFSGYLGGERQDFNYVYPMAGFNWMMKLSMTL
ncbi:MAG: TonB-dependent receptor [Bacteroidetes bacterium]|nr:MAG: TonB-dependent receptor [Bacteroidota bacterium]